jgi:hypothetical protein
VKPEPLPRVKVLFVAVVVLFEIMNVLPLRTLRDSIVALLAFIVRALLARLIRTSSVLVGVPEGLA